MQVKISNVSRAAARVAGIVAGVAVLLGAFLVLGSDQATAFDPLNPFSSFTDSGPVTPEEKEKRNQLRTDLYDRLSPAYRIDVPFVSPAQVTALEQAIAALPPDRGAGRLAGHDRQGDDPAGRHQLGHRHHQAAPHHRGRHSRRLRAQPDLRSGIPRGARPLPDPERPSRQRLRRFAHARRAQCERARALAAAWRAISPAFKV